jgi:hypothetical protein
MTSENEGELPEFRLANNDFINKKIDQINKLNHQKSLRLSHI